MKWSQNADTIGLLFLSISCNILMLTLEELCYLLLVIYSFHVDNYARMFHK